MRSVWTLTRLTWQCLLSWCDISLSLSLSLSLSVNCCCCSVPWARWLPYRPEQRRMVRGSGSPLAVSLSGLSWVSGVDDEERGCHSDSLYLHLSTWRPGLPSGTMNYLPLVLAVINLSRHDLVQAEVKRKIVQIPGDLVLGGLFPMHEQVNLTWVLRR